MTLKEYKTYHCQCCKKCEGTEYYQSHCPDIDIVEETWDAAIDNQKTIDAVCYFLRNETGCGLSAAHNYITSLINAINHHPIYRTDSTLKLVYEEPVSKDKLEDRASEYENACEKCKRYAGDVNGAGVGRYDSIDVFEAYIQGATDQQKIDIEKACNWLSDALQSGCHPCSGDRLVMEFREAMTNNEQQ